VIVRIQGSSLAAPSDIVLDTTTNSTTVLALASLSSQVANNAALQAAGISLTGTTVGGTLVFTSKRGEQLSVQAIGDVQNNLGLGSYQNNTSGATAFDYTTITGIAATAGTTKTDSLEFSIAGGAGIALSADRVACADERRM